jgi:ubiquinone biosynthesis protein
MMTAEGVGRSLNPNINMWELSEPLIREWAKANLSPRARTKAFLSEAAELIHEAPRMLRQLKELLERELEKRTESPR